LDFLFVRPPEQGWGLFDAVGPPIAAEVLKLSAKRSPAMLSASYRTLIKSKNPWNDRSENASQGKVTRMCHDASLGSGPSSIPTPCPSWGRATAERGVSVLQGDSSAKRSPVTPNRAKDVVGLTS